MAMTKPAGRLTTHVLDLMRGRPAAGVAIALFRLGGGSRALLASVRTNTDGRTDAPLLGPGELEPGAYELVFAIGDYFAASEPGVEPFIIEAPVRFRVADANAHHHVPLLASPFAFTTYRGS